MTLKLVLIVFKQTTQALVGPPENVMPELESDLAQQLGLVMISSFLFKCENYMYNYLIL